MKAHPVLGNRPGAYCTLVAATILGGLSVWADTTAPSYDELRANFAQPDHARWGEVPLWWWEGQPMTAERATAELEVLAAKGEGTVDAGP